MAESRRTLIRILSNYGRLFVSVLLGLYLAQLQLQTLGEYGFGLLALLGSTTGFAAIFEQVTGWSMIRELGAAHHSGDRDEFRMMFNSALVVCMCAAVLTVAVFAIIFLSLPYMDIAPEILPAARWFIVAKAVEIGVMVLLTPQCNLYLIQERMVAYNFWLTCRRASIVVAALSLFWLNSGGDVARGLILYGWISSALFIVVMVLPAAFMTMENRDLIPRLHLARRSGIRAIVHITGWNMLMQGATTLALPVGAILMNLSFGVQFGNVVFGVATRLAAYTRMLASGMSAGLDAVSTRISAAEDSHKAMKHLVHTSTMLHGLVVFPSVIGVGILAEPMIHVWLGKSMATSAELMPSMVTMLRILLVGFTGLAMFDCWTRILYGAGHVKKYAPLVVLTNIGVLILAVVFLKVFPDDLRYTGVACGFSAVYIICYATVLPQRLAKSIHIALFDVYRPLIGPLVAAIVCTPILLVFVSETRVWDLKQLILATGMYGCAYALLAWFLILPPNIRIRLRSIVSNRIRMVRV